LKFKNSKNEKNKNYLLRGKLGVFLKVNELGMERIWWVKEKNDDGITDSKHVMGEQGKIEGKTFCIRGVTVSSLWGGSEKSSWNRKRRKKQEGLELTH